MSDAGLLAYPGQFLDGQPLEVGASYCLILHSEVRRKQMLDTLASKPSTAVVAYDGGLISNLTLRENLLLPAAYHAAASLGDLAGRITEILSRCGLHGDAEADALLGLLPGEASLYQKRLAGFVRAMLQEPDLMIYDRIFDGVAREDAERIVRFDALFHLYFPFRTSVLLSYGEREEIAGHYRLLHI